ncbi:MAG: DUF1398 family protein [Terracidiphilus sp.]
MSKQSIHEAAIQTQLGNITFPQVVQTLLANGVESYQVDYATAQKTHYLADGSSIAIPMILDPGSVAADFDAEALVAAIRGAQADTIRYPEFVRRATAAGVTSYRAFLTGKRVVYVGRKGEQHIEEFPKPKL